MGKLMEIAQRVIKEQRKPAVPGTDRHACGLPGDVQSGAVCTLTGYDINDINDRSTNNDGAALLSGPRRFSPKPEWLDEFAQSGRIVRVRLDALNEDVLFVADNAVPTAGLFSEGCAVYDADDLRSLVGATPDDFCFLHDLSRTLGFKIGDMEEERE